MRLGEEQAKMVRVRVTRQRKETSYLGPSSLLESGGLQ